MGTRKVIHVCTILVASTVAVIFVNVINKNYWIDRPVAQYPYLVDEIEDLVRTYSIPIGLIIFIAFYGMSASMLEIQEGIKYVIALSFLYPIIGIIRPGIGFLLFFLFPISMFIGIVVSTVLIVVTGRKKNQKGLLFSVIACIHNIFFVFVNWRYLESFASVFGSGI